MGAPLMGRGLAPVIPETVEELRGELQAAAKRHAGGAQVIKGREMSVTISGVDFGPLHFTYDDMHLVQRRKVLERVTGPEDFERMLRERFDVSRVPQLVRIDVGKPEPHHPSYRGSLQTIAFWCSFVYLVRDRDSGEPAEIGVTRMFNVDHDGRDAQAVARFLLEAFNFFALHEIRESIRLDGGRPFEPHNPDGSPR